MRAHRTVFASAFAAITLFSAACSDNATVTQPDAKVVGRRVFAGISITLAPVDTSVAAGSTFLLRSTATDRKGNAIAAEHLTWSTSDSTIASVDGRGNVSARAAGVATIKASYSNAYATSKVTVLASGTTTPPDTSTTTTTTPPPDTTTTTTSGGSTGGTTTPPPTGSYITLSPGQDIQAAVDANAAGTQFYLKAGTYHGQHIVPKSGDIFTGEAGAILDGDGSTQYAFDKSSSHPSNVTIQGLIIQNYNPDVQMGAILAGGSGASDGASGWVVQNNEIRYNATAGVRLGTYMKLLNNKIHHNGQIGIVGIGDSVLVEGNEISYNNYNKAYDFGWEAGGTKFVKTNNLIVRNNYSHDNYGPGFWTDIDNINTLYEGNRAEDNADAGIFHEISYKATIRNNIIRRNGFTSVAWLYGAGIFVSSSRDVEVYGNTVEDNANGITAVQQNRGSGAYGDHITQNVYVHDNSVKMTSGRTGMAQDVSDDAIFTSRNNRFASNHYTLGTATNYYEWMDGQINESKWQSYGQDVNGTFQR